MRRGVAYGEVAAVRAIHYALHPAVYHLALSSIDSWQSFMFVCVLMTNEVSVSFRPGRLAYYRCSFICEAERLY